MSLKPRLVQGLAQARQFSERLLSDFHTPADWVARPHAECNHALWFAGHMAMADSFMTATVAPPRATPLPERFEKCFGMGSKPTNDPADYPPPAEVLAEMRRRRETLLAALAELSEEQLVTKLPAGAPDFWSDYASVFEFCIWHEGLHAGQVTVARRSLGHAPVYAAP